MYGLLVFSSQPCFFCMAPPWHSSVLSHAFRPCLTELEFRRSLERVEGIRTPRRRAYVPQQIMTTEFESVDEQASSYVRCWTSSTWTNHVQSVSPMRKLPSGVDFQWNGVIFDKSETKNPLWSPDFIHFFPVENQRWLAAFPLSLNGQFPNCPPAHPEAYFRRGWESGRSSDTLGPHKK